jgi:hypothetical protein
LPSGFFLTATLRNPVSGLFQEPGEVFGTGLGDHRADQIAIEKVVDLGTGVFLIEGESSSDGVISGLVRRIPACLGAVALEHAGGEEVVGVVRLGDRLPERLDPLPSDVGVRVLVGSKVRKVENVNVTDMVDLT